MFHIDIQTVFLGYIIINIIVAFLIGSLYLQIRKRYPKSFLILLSFIMSASGNLILFFRNSLHEWIVILVGNTLVVSSTVILLIGFEQFANKRGVQIQNYLLIILFLLTQSYFTFFEPDMNIRSLIISISYLFLSSQIAWLMLIRTPLKMRKITRATGLVFCALFLISIAHIIFIIFKQEQAANYFSLGNSEAFFLFFYQIFLIVLAYSISLMYNRKLIVEVKEREMENLKISTEKFQLELDLKNKELTQGELKIASLNEVNKSIIGELKTNLDNLSGEKSPGIHNFSYKSKIWERFDARFRESNSYFYITLITNYPNLSANEIRVAFLVSQNYTTKEIAEILHRSAKTIENIRGLIRKKMNLPKCENLISFLRSI